jgi:hypothetical protein
VPARAKSRRNFSFGTTQYSAALGGTYKTDRERKKRLAEQKRERTRSALEDRRARIEEKKLRAQEAALDRKIEAAERKIEVAEKKVSKGALTEAGFAAIEARMKREIEKQEEYKAAVQAKNPSFGYGVYTPGVFGEDQIAHFKSKLAAEAWARSNNVKGYQIKRAFAKNPCASTRKERVSDRAKRYRANQPGCKPRGVKKCKLCGSKSDLMIDHIDGNESNGRKSNLRWLCRSCNTLVGAEMARTGTGRRTVQYNPGTGGAKTLGEYVQAVLQHTRGSHDAAGRIIHETPKSRRRQFASEIWSSRRSHGTERPGSGSGTDEPDWVTNPAVSAAQYRLAEAVLSGNNRESTMPRSVAREIVDRTPARLRSIYTMGSAGGSGPQPRARTANLRNPEPAQDDGSEEYKQASHTAELFHGRPVKEEIEVKEVIKTHDWYVSIGPLVKLKIRTLTKRNATLPFPRSGDGKVELFCSPDGRQFYLRGGDQILGLEPIGMGEGTEWYRDHMVIGECKEITYLDAKKFHKFKLIEYYHKLGEVTNKKPALLYDTLSKKLSIVGGQYRVELDDLIEGQSPGIVN